MALEGANVISSNPVYNSQPSVNLFAKTLQQQQLKAQAEQKALQEELGSIKSDGLREADKPVFYNKFDEWRNSTIQATKERDPQKKMMMQSEAEKKKLELADLVNQSKVYQKVRDQVNSHYIGKDPFDDYDEQSWGAWKNSDKLPITDPRLIKDISSLQIRPDTDSFMKDISSVNNELLKSNGVYKSTMGERVRSGNKVGTLYEQVKTVSPEIQAEKYATYLVTNRKAYKAAQALYPQLASQLPKDEFIAAVADDLAAKNPIRLVDKPRYEWDFKESDGDGLAILSSIGNPTTQVFEGKTSSTNSTGGSTTKIPKIISDRFITYDGGIVSLPQIDGVYNVKTGKTERIKSLDGAKITGLGYFPYKGGQPDLMMSVVQDDKEYLIPRTKIPEDLKNSKKYKAVAGKLGDRPSSSNPSTNKPSKSTGKKAVGGYKIGQVDGGYKYTGGDPSKQENWVKQ